MKNIVIIILAATLISCVSAKFIDEAIDDASWSTLEVLENVSDKTLAVYYFISTEDDDKELSEYLRQGLTTGIANAIQNQELDIKVISRRQLDQIMEEQYFQHSDLADEDTQVEIGKLLGADLILSGQLSWKDEEICHLDAQIIEIETGVVLGGFTNDFWVE